MIHVERSANSSPRYLQSGPARVERERAKKFFTADFDRQLRFPFEVYQDPSVLASLTTLFMGKCAYCERSLEARERAVDLYRPPYGVSERPEHPGYWWLAGDWTNMLLSCGQCSLTGFAVADKGGRGNRFPLAVEDHRAITPGEERGEEPLLLDPCRDNPEAHLVFDALGEVASGTRRGQVSISLYRLNRPSLVRERAAAARRLQPFIDHASRLLARRAEWRDPPLQELVQDLRAQTSAAEAFAGMKRQLLARLLQDAQAAGLDSAGANATSTPSLSKSARSSARKAFAAFQKSQSDFELSSSAGREAYRSERRIIEGIRIRNIKAIRELSLAVPEDTSGTTPWLMLLGENGTGKSTLLQAVALTLLGAGGFVRLSGREGLRPEDFIRYRCRTAWIEVKLSGFHRPHRLTLQVGLATFRSPTGQETRLRFGPVGPTIDEAVGDPQIILLGYGATRLLPNAEPQPTTSTGDTYSRADNLFDPFVPLANAEAWLSSRPPLEFDTAALVLKDLLSLSAGARLEVEAGHVFVREHRTKVPLRRLSDGYQSVIATAIDILEVLSSLWPNLLEAEGIVLLDEIGAHLHPTWKMRIVGSLRKAMPSVQFIASTHDPLCLRGLGAGEVVVMRRDEDGHIEALSELPSPDDFSVEQLLTSDFFGLNTTDDLETETTFDEYYALLALRDLRPSQLARLAELRARLEDKRHLGSTLRERLMYEAIDELVAQHRQRPIQDFAALRADALHAVSVAWNQRPEELGGAAGARVEDHAEPK